MSRLIVGLLAVLGAAQAVAQELPAPKVTNSPEVEKIIDNLIKDFDPNSPKAVGINRPLPIPTPADAYRMARDDVRKLPADEQRYYRYFLTLDRSEDYKAVFDHTINSVLNHGSVPHRSTAVAGGWLLRINLQRLWPQDVDFIALIPIYEELKLIDPYFHTLGEIETVTEGEKKLIDVPAYQQADENGKMQTYTKKWVTTEGKKEVVTAAEPSLHLMGFAEDPKATEELIKELHARTESDVPVLRADWFSCILLSTNPDDDGRYYQFRRIEKSDKNKTAEQKWLERQAVRYEEVKNIRSDQRVAKYRSFVTGKTRAVEYFFTSGVRASIGPGFVAITRDFFDGKIKAKDHVMKNLLEYKFDGAEAIGFTRIGLLEYILTDAAGELIDVAPQRLVTDKRVSDPFTKNLVAPISCMRCHAPAQGWLPVRNDVMTVTKGKYGLNIFDDTGDDNKVARDRFDRLQGLYRGEIEPGLIRARRTYATAVDAVTGNRDIEFVLNKTAEYYAAYKYTSITPLVACRELGWDVSMLEEEQQADFLDAIMPRLRLGQAGVSGESVILGGVKEAVTGNDIYIVRGDWELEYGDAMLRVYTEAIKQRAVRKLPDKPPEKN